MGGRELMEQTMIMSYVQPRVTFLLRDLCYSVAEKTSIVQGAFCFLVVFTMIAYLFV